jgi:hypothetical protein
MVFVGAMHSFIHSCQSQAVHTAENDTNPYLLKSKTSKGGHFPYLKTEIFS